MKKIIPLIICIALLSACNKTNTEVIGGADQPTNIYVAENNNSNHSFIGTVLEETTTYMIVEPSEDSIERKSSDKIQINYGVDHYDYLYGIGRKVIINYNGFIKETYPAQIYSNDIDHDGYDEFEISVKESTTPQKKKILNNMELYKNNSDFDLYYFGVEEVNVKVNGKEMSLENALRNGYLTLDGIIAKANQDTDEKEPGEKPYNLMYKDGGSMEYHYDNYTIIKCHTLSGNRDVYMCDTKTTLRDLMI